MVNIHKLEKAFNLACKLHWLYCIILCGSTVKMIMRCLCRQNCNRLNVTSNTNTSTNISNYCPNGRVELRVNYLAIISFSLKDWQMSSCWWCWSDQITRQSQRADGEQRSAIIAISAISLSSYWGIEENKADNLLYWIGDNIRVQYLLFTSGWKIGIQLSSKTLLWSRRENTCPTRDQGLLW